MVRGGFESPQPTGIAPGRWGDASACVGGWVDDHARIRVDPDPAADEHGPDRPVLEAQDRRDRRPASASEQDVLAVRVPVVRRVDL
jgi:hypothetical protein